MREFRNVLGEIENGVRTHGGLPDAGRNNMWGLERPYYLNNFSTYVAVMTTSMTVNGNEGMSLDVWEVRAYHIWNGYNVSMVIGH